jgi:hypothetical protein
MASPFASVYLLHEKPDLMEQTVALLNEEWPRGGDRFASVAPRLFFFFFFFASHDLSRPITKSNDFYSLVRRTCETTERPHSQNQMPSFLSISWEFQVTVW